jgi:hypothetical protein
MSTQMADSGGPLAATFDALFETKTAADVEGTMSYFSPDLATHIVPLSGGSSPVTGH